MSMLGQRIATPDRMARYLFASTALMLTVGISSLAAQSTAPTPKDLMFQKGVRSLAEKRYEDAEKLFRSLSEIEPENLRGVIGLAEAYIGQHKDDEALIALMAESQKYPARADLHYAMGNVAVHAGRQDMAIAEYQRALEGVDPSSRAAAE